MARNGRGRAGALAAAVVLCLGIFTGSAVPEPAHRTTLLVHGHAADAGLDCTAVWGRAEQHLAEHGHPRESMRTIGYYRGDRNCDTGIARATTSTPIPELAARLARHIHRRYTSNGEAVDVLGHSMGGLLARLAVLGTARDWRGFPEGELRVGRIVALGAPHRGVTDPNRSRDVQWESMHAGSELLRRLHEPANLLDRAWASGTDWTLVGSDSDVNVRGGSAVDTGSPADHKHRYLAGGEVSHTGLIERFPDSGPFPLRWWHAAEGVQHETPDGPAPVETIRRALASGR
ncbi:esterase/lipase family protein [Salinifilum ghardaiensis]